MSCDSRNGYASLTVPSSAKVKHQEPIIVSSNRFFDIPQYVSSIYAANPKKWGAILPWDFPQNATREQEENVLNEVFGEREAHLQGGITGNGDGYRFLKQVFYSVAHWNLDQRIPDIANWWWKQESNQDLINDPSMLEHMCKPGVQPETFFDAAAISRYGHKPLVLVAKHIRYLALDHQSQLEEQSPRSVTSPAPPASSQEFSQSSTNGVQPPPSPQITAPKQAVASSTEPPLHAPTASEVTATNSNSTVHIDKHTEAQSKQPARPSAVAPPVASAMQLAAYQRPVTSWHPEKSAFIPQEPVVNINPQEQGTNGGKRGNKMRRASRGARDEYTHGSMSSAAHQAYDRGRSFTSPFQRSSPAIVANPYFAAQRPPTQHHVMTLPEPFQARRGARISEYNHHFSSRPLYPQEQSRGPQTNRAVSMTIAATPYASTRARLLPSNAMTINQMPRPEDLQPDLVTDSFIGANCINVRQLIVFNAPEDCDMLKLFQNHGAAATRVRKHVKSNKDGILHLYFVEFDSHNDARRGLMLNELQVGGRSIVVQVTRESYDAEFAMNRSRRFTQTSDGAAKPHAWHVESWHKQHTAGPHEQHEEVPTSEEFTTSILCGETHPATQIPEISNTPLGGISTTVNDTQKETLDAGVPLVQITEADRPPKKKKKKPGKNKKNKDQTSKSPTTSQCPEQKLDASESATAELSLSDGVIPLQEFLIPVNLSPSIPRVAMQTEDTEEAPAVQIETIAAPDEVFTEPEARPQELASLEVASTIVPEKSKGPDQTESFSMFGKKQSRQKKKDVSKGKATAKRQSKEQSDTCLMSNPGHKGTKSKQKSGMPQPVENIDALETVKTTDHDVVKTSPSKHRGILGNIISSLARATSFNTSDAPSGQDSGVVEENSVAWEVELHETEENRIEMDHAEAIHDQSIALLTAAAQLSSSSDGTADDSESGTSQSAAPIDNAFIPNRSSQHTSSTAHQSCGDASDSSHTLSARSRSRTPTSEISSTRSSDRRLDRPRSGAHLIEAPPPRNRFQKRRRNASIKCPSPAEGSYTTEPAESVSSPATAQAVRLTSPIGGEAVLHLLQRGHASQPTGTQSNDSSSDVLWLLLPTDGTIFVAQDSSSVVTSDGSVQSLRCQYMVEAPDSEDERAHNWENLDVNSE